MISASLYIKFKLTFSEYVINEKYFVNPVPTYLLHPLPREKSL